MNIDTAYLSHLSQK